MRENLTKSPSPQSVIELKLPKITAVAVENFRQATRTSHSEGIPKTFVTLYRRGEFDWLERLHVDFHNLLHTDQEYVYLQPLKVGDEPTVRTHIVDMKERKNLTIMTLHSDILVGETVKVVAMTTFMIRQSLAPLSGAAE